jgi:signal transduction histidine kinase
VLGAGVVCLSADSSAGWNGLMVSVPGTIVVWYIGRVVRSRTALVTHLRERNIELRDQRDENARLEVSNERMRLSRELDQLLRTRLSELTRLAELGAHEEDAASTLARIEAESRTTLDQMRAVVGLLRDGDTAASQPQPTLAHLDALLLSEKGEGARLTVSGEPRVLPAALELSAYRVVEHLLDATGDTAKVDVHVAFGDDALEVTVSGSAPASRRQTETALSRARERLALHHGRLSAETAGGRTELTAALPVLAAA